MKLLLWIAVIWIAVLWYLHEKKQKAAAAAHEAAARAAAGAARNTLPERMLPCAHCGVHVPSSEALGGPDGKQYFCSDEHRLRHTA